MEDGINRDSIVFTKCSLDIMWKSISLEGNMD